MVELRDGDGLDYWFEMRPRKRGLSKQENRRAGCKGFGGGARHET
jgi:hypothetical protein